LGVVASGALRSFCACWTDNQFPSRMPFDATPFPRVMPVAKSGGSSPLSARLDRQLPDGRDPNGFSAEPRFVTLPRPSIEEKLK
jgi:hypothetical protein